jgi:hypothetical protein
MCTRFSKRISFAQATRPSGLRYLWCLVFVRLTNTWQEDKEPRRVNSQKHLIWNLKSEAETCLQNAALLESDGCVISDGYNFVFIPSSSSSSFPLHLFFPPLFRTEGQPLGEALRRLAALYVFFRWDWNLQIRHQRIPRRCVPAVAASVFYSLIWGSEPYRMSDSSILPVRVNTHDPQLSDIFSESLFPIRSAGEYYLKVPLRVLDSTSRVNPTH